MQPNAAGERMGAQLDAQFLLQRLDEIGHSLKQSDHALALIGVGSVGLELERLDVYSDLDFFAVVEPGHKWLYLENLDWLSRVHPIAFAFMNTVDGYKALYADGIFCEFAVFEPDELATIPYAPGRIVWKKPDAPESWSQPVWQPTDRQPHSLDWLLGEALTNLYVGMARDRRGETLSAMRFIQGYAVDRLLEMANYIEPVQGGQEDRFAPERRFEQRYPGTGWQLPVWLGGYGHNRAAALAMLAFLEQHFAVNQAIATVIRRLCE
ncbi:MAG: hypothetical protein IPK16_30170 [Anaerolineales bacterium]|nr:hypothetical protein [Anaerolineales bacterium]